MSILDISIMIFVFLETLNILVLYFFPDSKYGNGVAVFNSWFYAKDDETSELFAKYMANWVAGTKLIFIVLLIVILFMADQALKLVAILVVILSILSYFFRLRPIIEKLDEMGEITPKGYSKYLNIMIYSFVSMFAIAVVLHLFGM